MSGFLINPFIFGGSDPTFSSNRALLHFDAADGSTTFTDVTGRTWTRSGSGVEIDTAQSRFGGSSLYIPATTSNYLTTASDAALGIGSNDYTFEGWWRFETFPSGFNPVLDCRISSAAQYRPLVYLDNSRNIHFFLNGANRISGGILSTGTWYHIAISRSGTSTRMFVNGTAQGSVYTDGSAFAASQPIYLGAFGDNLASADKFNGWVDEFRFKNGAGIYTSNFTPSGPFPNS